MRSDNETSEIDSHLIKIEASYRLKNNSESLSLGDSHWEMNFEIQNLEDLKSKRCANC